MNRYFRQFSFARFMALSHLRRARVLGLGLSAALAGPALSQSAAQTLAQVAGVPERPHLSFHGTPGLIDMPTGAAMADADFAITLSHFGPVTRATVAFQVLPRLTGVFRYARIEEPAGLRTNFDRSFDLVYQLAEEGRFRPEIAVGLRDFGGTGLQSAEYLVASKSFASTVGDWQVTTGLGWGRLGTHGGFTNPLGALSSSLETRPNNSFGTGGAFEFGELFQGDAALFGGVSWQPTQRLRLMVEYSSDAYTRETASGVLNRTSPVNFGASYKLSDAAELGIYSLYGSEFGARLSYVINPKAPPAQSGIEPGPQPVQVRPSRRGNPQAWTTSWAAALASSEPAQAAVEKGLIAVLAPEGLILESLDLSASKARVSLRNARFDQSAQAVGRAARALTRALPASVETFEITLVAQGMPTTQVSLNRSDLEDLEFAPDNAWQSYVRAGIQDAGDQSNARTSIASPKLTFALNPYLARAFFDPDAPILFDFGVRATARYEPRPGWVVNASLRQPIYSNRSTTNRVSNSVLPFVRSEQDDYNRGNDPKLDRLTLAHYFRPGKDLYGRVTAGYLETAFAGVSGEVLWKPTTSRLALGLELNAVHQRQPGDPFGLGTGVYDNEALTGHASAYYAFENGFHAQVDLGRYLAEDWGGTVTVTREFRNGWRVGAFATVTDVSFDDFGEGSFDKGIFFTIPTSWSTGQPSRSDRTTTLRPILRDGGAKVRVDNRLYELVREDSDPLMADGWGRFWR